MVSFLGAGQPLTASGSTLYGITPWGGANGGGTLYSFNNTTNTENILHAFGGYGDAEGISGAINVSGSMLYGDAQNGGAYGGGAIYSYNLNTNSENVLYSFGGGIPISVTLSGSTLYGLTVAGTIFSYNLNTNTETNLFSSVGFPEGNLVVSGSTLYGVTSGGIYSYNIGTDTLTTLHSFNYSSDGGGTAGYIMLSGSTIYGMTNGGAAYNAGAIFSLNVNTENFTNLHSFNTPTDGGYPTGNLLLVGSTLYGMTPEGGAYGDGTLFSLTVPEPTPLCLLALGSIPLLLRRRRTATKM